MQGDASCASGTYDGPEASNATCSFNPNPGMSGFIIVQKICYDSLRMIASYDVLL